MITISYHDQIKALARQANIELKPIAIVKNDCQAIIDDNWGELISTIELDPTIFSPSATKGLAAFSHLDVIFYMHQVQPDKIVTGARHPRNNSHLPEIGILAQRGKNRPNQIGSSFAKLIRVNGLTIDVKGLDAINQTPILDIKPCFSDFLPSPPIKEPVWVKTIMKNYF